MANYAIVDGDGVVVNISVANRIEDVFVPDGMFVVPVDVGAEVGGTHDGTNFIPVPRPPPAPPRATGAQMVDEAKSRGKLDMLTAALTPSEMAIFVTRLRIVAGSNFAEVLRGKLGITVAQMAGFIATAAVRSEV